MSISKACRVLKEGNRKGQEVALRDGYTGPVVVIIGGTGSGKTGVAIEIALQLGEVLGLPSGEIGGEVISADSRAIYRYMDLGTAKPLPTEMKEVPHYGINLVEPGERYTVADWKKYAEQKICSIREKGHVPLVVGGTGLYVDALIYDYKFRGPTGERVSGLKGHNVQKSCADRLEMRTGYNVYGIAWEPNELRARLRRRANKLFVQELFEETESLVKKYGWDNQAMKSNIYQFAWRYMQGEISLQEAIDLNVYDDWHLVKRQLTWFKRNKNIKWLPLNRIKDVVMTDIKKDKGYMGNGLRD